MIKMNHKTIRLLERYSSISEKNISELKLWWKSIPHNKRHRERIRITQELKS